MNVTDSLDGSSITCVWYVGVCGSSCGAERSGAARAIRVGVTILRNGATNHEEVYLLVVAGDNGDMS